MILLIDNYDSFTWNIAQAVGAMGAEIRVVRNDSLTADEAVALGPRGLILSPGPGGPPDAGISIELIRRLFTSVPILGVCLGHQCIASAFGGTVREAARIVHGKTSPVHHDSAGIFKGVPSPFEATRYHSLAVAEEGLPGSLEVTAQTSGGEIMGIRHRSRPVEGVQFHPESILTRHGNRIFRNFFDQVSSRRPIRGAAAPGRAR